MVWNYTAYLFMNSRWSRDCGKNIGYTGILGVSLPRAWLVSLSCVCSFAKYTVPTTKELNFCTGHWSHDQLVSRPKDIMDPCLSNMKWVMNYLTSSLTLQMSFWPSLLSAKHWNSDYSLLQKETWKQDCNIQIHLKSLSNFYFERHSIIYWRIKTKVNGTKPTTVNFLCYIPHGSHGSVFGCIYIQGILKWFTQLSIIHLLRKLSPSRKYPKIIWEKIKAVAFMHKCKSIPRRV